MRRGAEDFLTKPFRADQLLEAIGRAVARGARERAAREERARARARVASLSPREREVCALVVKGLLNKQIGAVVGSAENTVKVHRSRAMQKLGVSTVPDLVRLVDLARPDDGGG
jgi:FixJ family two-component response regulator